MCLDRRIYGILKTLRKCKFLLRIYRRFDLVHILPGQILERFLTEHITAAILNLDVNFGLRHHCSALCDETKTSEDFFHIRDVRSSRKIPCACLVRHDVRSKTATVRCVMDSRLVHHMLSQVVCADTRQFHCIEGTSSALRRKCCMGGASFKFIFYRCTCKIALVADHVRGHRMPAECHITAVKHVIICHLYFSAEKLFLRTAIETDGSRNFFFLKETANRNRSGHSTCTEKIVTTAMSRCSGSHRLFCDLTFLGKSRKCIVLTENCDHRTSASILCIKCMWKMLIVRDCESLFRQKFSHQICRALLISTCLRVIPEIQADVCTHYFKILHVIQHFLLAHLTSLLFIEISNHSQFSFKIDNDLFSHYRSFSPRFQ